MSFYIKIIIVMVSVDMGVSSFTHKFMILKNWLMESFMWFPMFMFPWMFFLMMRLWLNFLCLSSSLLVFLMRWRWLLLLWIFGLLLRLMRLERFFKRTIYF